MKSSTVKKYVILIYAFILWILCVVTVGIGRLVTSIELTLIIHAIAAPIFASIIAWFFYRKYFYTSPLQTAVIFTLFIIIIDAGLIAPVFENSYDMFKSILGTWLPFLLIFISVYFTGKYINIRKENIYHGKN
jgi:hypothetical protein